MPLFLGIDGGQSSTTAVIGDERGDVLGIGRGGPCNHTTHAEGRARFFNAVEESLCIACRAAALDAETIEFEVVCAGFSGGPQDKEAYLRELIRSRKHLVTDDAVIALSGATAGEPGIITIAGTGSISYGRNAAKSRARAGGWGYVFGDEGSGFDITRQALRAVLRLEEGWGAETVLRDLLLSAAGASGAHDLMHRFYTPEFPKPMIASWSKLVDEAASNGDSVAQGIMVNAAQQLALQTSAVRNQLFDNGAPARVVPVGGVFRSLLLLQRFRMLIELEDGNEFTQPQHGPGAGALIEALAAAGLKPRLTGLTVEK